MPTRYEHDHSVCKGRLRYRVSGPVLTDHETFNAGVCPECGVDAAEPLDERGTRRGCRACGVVQVHLLKVLPCQRCGQAKLNGGQPYTIGRAPLNFPFSYSCAQCKRSGQITAAEWSRLPSLEPEEYIGMLGPKGKAKPRSERKVYELHPGLPRFDPKAHASGLAVVKKEGE